MKRLTISLLLALLLVTAFDTNAQLLGNNCLTQTDGPYVEHRGNSLRIMRISQTGDINIAMQPSDMPFDVLSHSGEHKFTVKLHEINRPQWKYDMPERVLVMSDPHGNMDALVSVLRSQGVIDKNYNWSFGQGHFMLIGDVFDRGDDVVPIFWLLYKLEEEARNDGGALHFLLGNHEEMVLRNDLRYMTNKYVTLDRVLGVKHGDLYGLQSELGRWLRTRNTIEIIGNDLFVHAGLSKKFAENEWSVPVLNEKVSSLVDKSKKERDDSGLGELFRSDGPLWYRGLVKPDKTYVEISPEDLDRILGYHGVGRIYVGHTIFPEVTCFHDGKVVGVNVDNKANMKAGLDRGVLIEGGTVYRIYDDRRKNERLELTEAK